MTTTSKRRKKSINRQHSNEICPKVNNNNDSYDLVTDHSFVAPNEICCNGMGFSSTLMHGNLLDVTFSKLYQQSQQVGWEHIFQQERQKLKPNDVSVLKCFVLNRMLHEYYKSPDGFAQKAKDLHDEIKSRMTRDFAQWTPKDLFNEVRRWRDMQCRRRLFYFHYREMEPLPAFLMLQKASTNWCHCLLKYCQQNKGFWQKEGRSHFMEHFQHSFIIVAQPTGSEGAAVTQYIKTSTGHSAKLNTRIICLLDPDVLRDHIELSNIDVVLFPLNREANSKQEPQPSLQWEIRRIMSAEGTAVSILYAEVNTLELGNFDSVYKRLSFNSTLCQLEFHIKIRVKEPEYRDTIKLVSQPFGICSHGQYFPKFVAQIFFYEIKQILNSNNPITDPGILVEFVRRYYIRMTGIELNDHTSQYILNSFAKVANDMKNVPITNPSDNAYEEVLAKILSQIHFMVLHPVLSLMYNDRLFLGICNNIEVDQMLNGTKEQPQLLLRLNSLINHQWNANVTVHCIIHDGQLKRASFDMKTFANELCRFICESVNESVKQGSILSLDASRTFSDFRWYFHDELYRLNKMSSPSTDTYDPLLPILWMAMRNYDNTEAVRSKLSPVDRSSAKKRRSSDSLPLIESVTSVTSLPTMNIVLNLENKDDTSMETIMGSPNSNSSTLYRSSSSSTVGTDGACQSNNQEEAKKNRQFLIELPSDIEVSPAVLFRHLAEKFASMPNTTNEDAPSNYFIRSKSSGISLSHIPTADLNLTTNAIRNGTAHQVIIKQEPKDVDCI